MMHLTDYGISAREPASQDKRSDKVDRTSTPLVEGNLRVCNNLCTLSDTTEPSGPDSNFSPVLECILASFNRGKDLTVYGALPRNVAEESLVAGTLSRVDTTKQHCQALVLSSTRDRAEKTHALFLEHGLSADRCHFFQSRAIDVERVKQGGVSVAFGTPGRIYDVMKGHHLSVDSVQVVVLDQVDEMLSQDLK